MQLSGKRVVVVGLAQTGVSVARFCADRGARVVVTDASPASKLAARVDQLGGCAELELGGHEVATFTAADLVVMSPGVPELSYTRAARDAGVEVIAEIELAYRCFDRGVKLIAITGTNGKSTTTALAGALCAAADSDSFCGGNLGNHPLIEAADHAANKPGGLVVAEVAGFMLETCTSFRPMVAACLNITPDHLDRYGTFDVYASMKTRVYEWQTGGDWSIANARDQRTVDGARARAGKLLLFDSAVAAQSAGSVEQGACLSAARDQIVLRIPGASEERYPISDLPIIGTHNLENAMAAYLSARLVGVSPEEIRIGARSFQPQKHRMELVGRIAAQPAAGGGDIAFYDDSKGTNVAAVAASMRGFPRPAVLIAGGVDKGGSYEPMLDALDQVARGMVLIGQAAPLIAAAARERGVSYPVLHAATMQDAVRSALELATAGDAIVLSPACSSYDMFKNFGERGMAFRDAVSGVGAERLDS